MGHECFLFGRENDRKQVSECGVASSKEVVVKVVSKFSVDVMLICAESHYSVEVAIDCFLGNVVSLYSCVN